jgi:hypothetical protein
VQEPDEDVLASTEQVGDNKTPEDGKSFAKCVKG